MRMHVLTAAVLVALASRAALAASEGGDTWSAIPQAQRSAHSVLRDTQRPWAEDSAWVGSDGGDTWSSVQALRETSVQQAGLQHGPGRTGTTYAGAVSGSEGGDTWSRFVPQVQSQPTGLARVNGNKAWLPPFGE